MFAYHPSIIEKFPHVVGGILSVKGIQNGASAEEFKAVYIAEQQAVLARLGETPLSQLESLAAWRRALSSFGVDPTQYRTAAEALLRRLQKKGDIPSINLLVDIANLVSIRYALPVAAVDTRDIQTGLLVQFAQGDEPFTELGAEAPVYPDPGEVIFADAAKVVYARRWCWRQSAQSAAREDTQQVIVTIEAQHPNSQATVAQAQADFSALLAQFIPSAQVESALLDKNRLSM